MDNILILTKKNQNQEIDYNNAIILEDVGKFIFTLIMQNKNENNIINNILKEYDVHIDTAKKDFKNFIEQLVQAEIIHVE